MKTYKIIGLTNGWIAQRDIRFKGKCEITIADGLTLGEAQKKLLEIFCITYDHYYSNWGLARCNHPFNTWSYPDGLRGYDHDGRYYRIVEEEDRE